MKAKIIQIGNSRGVRIPETLLERVKIEDTVELEVTPEGLLMRPAAKRPRAGWAEQFASALAEGSNDAAEDV